MNVFAESSVLLLASTATAAAFGLCFGATWMRGHTERHRKRQLHRASGLATEKKEGSLLPRPVRYAANLSRRIELGASSPSAPKVWRSRAARWLTAHAQTAGIARTVSPAGFVEAMIRSAFMVGGVSALVGVMFSTELAILAGLAGAVGGALSVPRAIVRLEHVRAAGLERDLSEMLEVVALGLRSGLSFERSFELYGTHFKTDLANACAAAQRSWTFGLVTREAALRDLAASYDSALFARVIEGAVRALRFGSSLAENLESAAIEARAVHRAHVEEQVAKAPVKMMLPTGALILPAMLLLVLGPVLLELMEGF